MIYWLVHILPCFVQKEKQEKWCHSQASTRPCNHQNQPASYPCTATTRFRPQKTCIHVIAPGIRTTILSYRSDLHRHIHNRTSLRRHPISFLPVDNVVLVASRRRHHNEWPPTRPRPTGRADAGTCDVELANRSFTRHTNDILYDSFSTTLPVLPKSLTQLLQQSLVLSPEYQSHLLLSQSNNSLSLPK